MLVFRTTSNLTVKFNYKKKMLYSSFVIVTPVGLTLRLKGKEIIQKNGDVNINDLPVGGCRRYETLECLSDVPYRGGVENAYWKYTDLDSLVDHKIDDIHCEDSEDHKCWQFGWQSNLGIYKKGKKYYGVVRLGRQNETATMGHFTCHFEGDTVDDQVSVNIIGECEVKYIYTQ